MLRHALLRPLSSAAATASSAHSAAAAASSAAAASASASAAMCAVRGLHSSAFGLRAPTRPTQHRLGSKGPRVLPTRTARHDAEWDKVRSHRDPLITTVDPSAPLPALPLNDL